MAKKTARPPKFIKVRADIWEDIADLANDLQKELGMTVYLPDAISFSIKFTRENRHKLMAGSPGGQARGKKVIS